MTRSFSWLFFLSLFYCSLCTAQKHAFLIRAGEVTILWSREGPRLDSVAAHLLAADIEGVTGKKVPVTTDVAKAAGNVIVIGNITSGLVQRFIGSRSPLLTGLQNQWESFAFRVVDKPMPNIAKSFVIAGSDARGTAYGVFTLSEKLGVSPWYWWADVPVRQQKELVIQQADFISSPPSVKYRGIFINDEDWGLQPWAAKTFEPETGDIGPKTYAKVFELLLRLKANLIWPAMHPSTKAFFYYPGNVQAAADYAIIIGSSHAEPMLRNNVGEWNEKTMGHFNYLTNKKTVYTYWQDRVKQSSSIHAMYSIGMRGVHDSGIEGVKDPKEAVPLLERIFADQRGLLARYINKDTSAVPQVFTAYKEVLDIYDKGLKVPDDVTLVWPDDNYGYIQRLNNPAEKSRPGGSGVYYHASYWGRPHDYLWLSTTHPALIQEEMMKAYENGSNRLWVLNVGDIKPLEYNIQLFLDMAYHAAPFRQSSFIPKHLQAWHQQIFGAAHARQITRILWEYYNLAFERRPEFMGWSQTEPTTKTGYTTYNHFYYGDEAQKRIDRYDALEKSVKMLRRQLPSGMDDAFYELVYYPVVGASLMNKKFLYRDKSYLYARQNRLSAFDYALWSKAAYDSIEKETTYFNTQLAGGKWKGIMSMKPRDLPVYQQPVLPEVSIDKTGGWNVAPEGFVRKDSSLTGSATTLALPSFDALNRQKYFVDVFLSEEKPVAWKASSDSWIRLSANSGLLGTAAGKKQVRLWVTVDWNKLPAGSDIKGRVVFTGNGKQATLQVNASNLSVADLPAKGFVENNGYVSLYAAHFTRRINKQQGWEEVDYAGHTGKAMQVSLSSAGTDTAAGDKGIGQSCLEWDFTTFSAATPVVHLFSLPTHPLNNRYSLRCAVSIDDGPLQTVDFRTYGRTEEWKQNVLHNQAEQVIRMPRMEKGKHTVKIYAVDPGVILDRILIDLGGLKQAYSAVPETKKG